MGQCCLDFFKKLMNDYGETFVKLMVCEKGKGVVHEEFGKARTDFQKAFGDVTKHANTLVDSKTAELTKLYEDAKNKVAAVPGALQQLEKSQGQPLDDLSGYNSLKGQINTVRKDTLNKMDQERSNIENRMGKTEAQMIAEIDKERPYIK
jgi:hypothetical protein